MTTNADIGMKLREMADLLDAQGADRYRAAAYRRAAVTIETLDESVSDIASREGLPGLDALPAIGRGIAAAISEMVSTGRWSALDRLTGSLEPIQIFQTIPGIGPELAERIHDALHIDTLEALELAAHDGRLEAVPGIGARRTAAIRAVLAERLGHRRVRVTTTSQTPAVGDILDVDREYRDAAETGALRKIAPKRFNPTGEAWMPVLHARRGDWDFTALFSNTQTAHKLGRTRDWVVIYFHHRNEPEQQVTVVTETRGALAGCRVVRGREGDCATFYAGQANRDDEKTGAQEAKAP